MATLSISDPIMDSIVEPSSETDTFTVTVTLMTEGGATLGSSLDVSLMDGGGSAGALIPCINVYLSNTLQFPCVDVQMCAA